MGYLIRNLLLLFLHSQIDFCRSTSWSDLNLPAEHLTKYFNRFPQEAAKCRDDHDCPFKKYLFPPDSCWGYEKECRGINIDTLPSCPGDHKGWVNSKDEQLQEFYSQADFGYVRRELETFQSYCTPFEGKMSSSLECSDHLHFCKGHNIYLDLRSLVNRKTPIRYHMDVLTLGDVRGHCRLNRKLLDSNCDMLSPLQSWGPELRYFNNTDDAPDEWECDVWYDRPVIISKIDASVSLYHHFCDFFNLYASQHINNTDPTAFSTDVQVIIWESYPYRSSFGTAWNAFTKHPIQNLADVAGKRLCFRQVMFPLLPRMIFGLYYNTPLIWGCEKSGLFQAFNRHMLHRLGVPHRDSLTADATGDGRVHVTVLARQTQHRRVLNQDALIEALRVRKDIVLKIAQFDHGHDFTLQLKAIADTDVLVGMHGAGLTHLLFLPDWAAVFELYNCGDEHCYKDLARLRGLSYFTWEEPNKMRAQDEGHHPQLGAHEKFTNYEFDVDEFMAIMDRVIIAVKSHPKWKMHNGLNVPEQHDEF